MNYKHIALWACPRSCSSLIGRSFDQRKDCVIYEEPFYPPYLLTHGLDHPMRDELITYRETDYKKIIQQITGELKNGYAFSFQKHIAKNVLPEYGLDWLAELKNFFLIREPARIIKSYIKVVGYADEHSVGFKDLLRIFKAVQKLKNETPIVIDASDILRNPKDMINKLCDKLDIPRDENMFRWEANSEGSGLMMGTNGLTKLEYPFQKRLWKSTGFMPYEEKEVVLEAKYRQLEEESLEIYHELYQYKLQ